MSNEQELNETSLSTNNSELQGQLIQNFDKMIIKEIGPMAISSKQENHSTEKDFNIMVDDNWSYVMGITPSTATQVASPISTVSVINSNYSHPIQDEEEEGEWLTEDEQEETPVSVINSNYSHPIQDEEEEGEWLTEDEQEEIVLDSSSADIKKEGF
ncbi:hypothetical protein RhiirA5_84559 [Rhizophagus irregularis]|uniref:Uncharacterized protein n=1 Tax=Rhizophagus irregularis TaxID=588596 RepID=A0A2N0NXY8_9GLOM|nr:hypothetical protein RhiirA5_84559 [Rhizophagus irregularis]